MKKDLLKKIKATEPGTYVKLTATNDRKYSGILMPQGKDAVFIKLDNGYNIGIDKKNIISFEVLKEKKALKVEYNKKPQKFNKSLPTIAILHTGGTISSKVDYRTGAVYSAFTPEDIIAMFPELTKIANIKSKLISNMFSDDLRFKNLAKIATEIESELKSGVDGIIVSIGTDNLAVASAAISFMVEKTPVPIIFVGAQRSSDRPSSDAFLNLVSAAYFIARTDFAGIAISMHSSMSDTTCSILPATKTRKMHSSRRDAFKPVNDTEIAIVDYLNDEIKFIKKDYPKKNNNREYLIKPGMEEKVAILKVHINMFPEQIDFFREHNYKGLVIEGTGLGHTPGHATNKESEINKKIFPAIKKLVDSGCIVVMATQCIYGRVNMNVYSKGKDLLGLGVISADDMLSETAFVKLSWLLKNYPEKAKEMMHENLRGEINKRHLP